jgi:hypothetical protein
MFRMRLLLIAREEVFSRRNPKREKVSNYDYETLCW